QTCCLPITRRRVDVSRGETVAASSRNSTKGGTMNRSALLVVTVVGGLLATAATARSRASDVDEVWAMEDTYWRYVKAGDVEKYRTLWNDGFRGWPCHNDHPATKAEIGDWVREIR